jgi:hypothetical protein
MQGIFLIVICILSLFGNPTARQKSDVLRSVSKAATNPIMYVGIEVHYQGIIKKILKSGTPLTLLLEAEGYLWIANIYDPDRIPKGIIKQGKMVGVEGIIAGVSKPLLIDTTRQSLLEVMVESKVNDNRGRWFINNLKTIFLPCREKQELPCLKLPSFIDRYPRNFPDFGIAHNY